MTPTCELLGASSCPPYLQDWVPLLCLRHNESFRGAAPLVLCDGHYLPYVRGRNAISCLLFADAPAVYTPSASRKTKLLFSQEPCYLGMGDSEETSDRTYRNILTKLSIGCEGECAGITFLCWYPQRHPHMEHVSGCSIEFQLCSGEVKPPWAIVLLQLF